MPPLMRKGGKLKEIFGDVGSNTTLHCKRKDLNRCSLTRIPVQRRQELGSGMINFLFINTCSPVPPRPSDIILDFRFEYLIIYV